MSNDKSATQTDKPDTANDSTQMAVERTLMAADRSLMAWVRTGLSLISFGFTIYKFLENSAAHLEASGKVLNVDSSPKTIGLFMIGMGLFSLIFGTIENTTIVNGLRKRHEFRHTSYARFMSWSLMVFGLVLFLGILLRLRGIA